MDGYYFLHEDGDLIWKRSRPRKEPGGFVLAIWPINVQDRRTAWRLILEALALTYGTHREARCHANVQRLCLRWWCSPRDLVRYLESRHEPSGIEEDGLRIYLRKGAGADPDEWLQWFKRSPENFSSMPIGPAPWGVPQSDGEQTAKTGASE